MNKKRQTKFVLEAVIGLFAAIGLSGWVTWQSTLNSQPIPEYRIAPIQWQDYALVAPTAAPIVDDAPAPVKESAAKSVVGIFPLSLKGSPSQLSSGVVMSVGESGVSIATNRHVIQSVASFDGTVAGGFSGKVGVYFEANGEKFVAEGTVLCVGGKKDVDMAFVRIPSENSAYLSPVKMPDNLADPEPGIPVWVAGSGDGAYGNLRATQTTPPQNDVNKIRVPGINGDIYEYNPKDLIWFAARDSETPAGPPGASGGAVLDETGTLRAFTFIMDPVTKGGAGVALGDTNDWLENPTCDPSYLSGNSAPQSQPQARSQPQSQPQAQLPKKEFRPIGEGRSPGQSKNPPGTDNPEALQYVKTAYEAVVCVGGFEPSIGADVCASGTSIDPALVGRDPIEGAVILTCDHVIANTGPNPDVKLKSVNSEPLPGAQVIHSSSSLDLALVAVSQTLPIAQIAPADYEPEPGTPIWAIGFPRTARGEMVISPDGVAQGMMGECLAQAPCIAIGDGVITNGNSGGMLADAGDRLIGVTEGETIEEVAIPPSQIHAFLEEAKTGGTSNLDGRGSGRGPEGMPPGIRGRGPRGMPPRF